MKTYGVLARFISLEACCLIRSLIIDGLGVDGYGNGTHPESSVTFELDSEDITSEQEGSDKSSMGVIGRTW